MTMVRLESSSVLLRVRSQRFTQMMNDEDYSDRARPSTLPAIMQAGEKGQIVMGTS